MTIKEKYLKFGDHFEYTSEPSITWESIAPLAKKFLHTIHKNQELLNELYVPVKPFLLDGTNLATTFLNIAPDKLLSVIKERSNHKNFQKHFSTKLQESQGFHLTLILAPTGSGKTTFLHYQLSRLSSMAPTIICKPIIIDVLETITTHDDFLQHLKFAINKTISNSYKCFHAKEDSDLIMIHKSLCEIFKEDLLVERIISQPATPNENPTLFNEQSSFFRKLENENFAYFQKNRLAFAKQQEPNVALLLAIDNMDQHLPFQINRQQMIIDAAAIAAAIEIPLIITLRNTSFRTNNPEQALASYEIADYFYLDHIDLTDILGFRLKKICEEMETRKNENTMGMRFIKVIEGQFNQYSKSQSSDSHFAKALPWIDSVANNNKRKSLEVIRKALESKFIIQKGYERYPETVDDRIFAGDNIHVKKLMKALLLGNNNYFIGDLSDANFINLFDCDIPEWGLNNLFRIKLLQHLVAFASSGKTLQEILVAFMKYIGPEYEHIILDNIRVLIEKGLALIYKRSSSDNSIQHLSEEPIDLERYMGDRLLITTNGRFHIEKLIFDDTYLDEMKFASWLPINCFNDVFSEYKGGYQPFRVSREKSTLEFINHIKGIEDKAKYFEEGLDIAPIMPLVLDSYSEAAEQHEFFIEVRKTRPIERLNQ